MLMMPVTTSSSTTKTSARTVPLTPQAAALRRLDDKLATGMKIVDVSHVRWLTAVEVLQYLDEAASKNEQMCTAPPSSPPKSGKLLLYDASQTPNYAEDGIDWVQDAAHKEGGTWKSIDGVLARSFDDNSGTMDESESDGDNILGASGRLRASSNSSDIPGGIVASTSMSSTVTALHSGAWAEYLSCATRRTFHRREYRAGPNPDIVLLHYLDSAKALRICSELIDRIVMLSADSGAGIKSSRSSEDATPTALPTPRSSVSGTASTQWCPTVDIQQGELLSSTEKKVSPGHRRRHSRNKSCDLGDTMNILLGMVNEHEAAGTSVAEAVNEHVLNAATDAALSAVMKHISPDEATCVVDAMEMAIEDSKEINLLNSSLMNDDFLSEAEVTNIHDVTDLDIDEAIEQIMTGGGTEGDADAEAEAEAVESLGSKTSENAAKIIEDQILDSMEDVLPDYLQEKLIDTTERMLKVKGISLNSGSKGSQKKPVGRKHLSFFEDSASSVSASNTSVDSSSKYGTPLPEIVDITPDFHVAGYAPPSNINGSAWKGVPKMNKTRSPRMVISTETPIPELPPFVDQYFVWEKFAAFVSIQEIAMDPQIRNVSFQRLNNLTPFSYKCKMPADIPNFSIRHIVVVGVLLPKDHRVRRNMSGIELALKLCIQTEWAAATDLLGTSEEYKKSLERGGSIKPLIRGLERPLFIAPSGGERMQLLTQISPMKFTMYQATASPLLKGLNFIQDVAMNADGLGTDNEKGREEKRKRDDYLEEWAASPRNDSNMSTDEVDRNHKVRFVERISGAIADDVDNGSENILEGLDVDNMSDHDIDSLLGRVLVRYVGMVIKESKDTETLCRELNFCGYAGLSLLHHASFYNFKEVISLLLSNGADPNVSSAEGDLKPLHFAAAAGQMDVVELLIQAGCDTLPIDSNNQNPADHARRAGHFNIARYFDSCSEQLRSAKENSNNEETDTARSPNTSDIFLQSAFKELSLKDKLGLNLFVERWKPSTMTNESKPLTSTTVNSEDLGNNTNFSFISEEDRAKLREAMSLASEMDVQEMNLKAEHQDIRRYLRQSNYEAISAASTALKRAHEKEANILKSASISADDPSKMQLSRALAMLVLRKNLPT